MNMLKRINAMQPIYYLSWHSLGSSGLGSASSVAAALV